MSHEDEDDASVCPLGGKCLFDGGCVKHGHDRCIPPSKEDLRGRARELRDRMAEPVYEE